MTDLHTAAKQALEALELEEAQTHYPPQWLLKAIAALRQALANSALDKMAENARELGLDYELQDKDPDLIEQPAQQQELKICNCRWDGDAQVQQCTLHQAHVDAIHEWAERAKTAEAKLKEQPDYKALYEKAVQQYNELAELMADQPAQQEPVAVECKFDREKEWGRCSIEHHNLVQSEPHKWPGYQTRLLYTRPQAREPLTMIEMIDAAMVATRNIYPPITRSQCETIIRAAAHGIGEKK